MSLFDMTGFVRVVIGGALQSLSRVERATDRTAATTERNMRRTENASRRAASTMTTAFNALAAAFAGALGSKALSNFAKFNQNMHNLDTIAKLSTENFKQFHHTISQFSAKQGLLTGATENANALFEIYSANVLKAKDEISRMAEAQEYLKQASMAATAGVTTTTVAVDVLTNIVNTYGDRAGSLSHINDVLFKTVEIGKVRYEELANSLGFVVGQAVAAEVSFEELSAVLATLTAKGLSASIASRNLRTMIGAITNPSKAAKEAMERYGFVVDQHTLAKEGLAKTIQKVVEYTNGDMTAMKAIFRENTAVTAATLLASDGFDQLGRSINGVANSSGAFIDAFNRQKDSLSNTWKAFIIQIEAASISVGEHLLPTLISVINFGSKIVETFNLMPGPIKTTLISVGTLTTAILGLIIIMRTAMMASVLGAFTAMRLGIVGMFASISALNQILLTTISIFRILGANAALGFIEMSAHGTRAMTVFIALRAVIATLLGPWGLVLAAVTAVAYASSSMANTVIENEKIIQGEIKKTADALKEYAKLRDEVSTKTGEQLKEEGKSWNDIVTWIRAAKQQKSEIWFSDAAIPQKESSMAAVEEELAAAQSRLEEMLIDTGLPIEKAEAYAEAIAKGSSESYTSAMKELNAREQARRKEERDKQLALTKERAQFKKDNVEREKRLEPARKKAINAWTEFKRKQQAGVFGTKEEELSSLERVARLQEAAEMDAELKSSVDPTKKLIVKHKDRVELETEAIKLGRDAVKERDEEEKATNKEKLDAALSAIQEKVNAEEMGAREELTRLKKIKDTFVMTKEEERQLREKIGHVIKKIKDEDKKAAEEAKEAQIRAIKAQAEAVEAEIRGVDRLITAYRDQGKSAADINTLMEKRLNLTMKQLALEEKAAIKGAKSEEEKEAVRNEYSEKREVATIEHGNKQRELAQQEIQRVNVLDGLQRELNEGQITQLDDYSRELDKQEEKGQNVSTQRVALVKKENEIKIANIKNEMDNRIRDLEAQGGKEQEINLIQQIGKQKIADILRDQKSTIDDILNKEKERNQVTSPVQTFEEAMMDINRRMGTSAGSFGVSNLGAGGAFGRPGVFSSPVRSLKTGISSMQPTFSLPGAPGSNLLGTNMYNAMNNIKTDANGKAISNVSSTSVSHKARIEVDVNGRIKVADGSLSEATLNGLFADTGTSRILGSDPSRSGRQV